MGSRDEELRPVVLARSIGHKQKKRAKAAPPLLQEEAGGEWCYELLPYRGGQF